jgi:hypothetical protein
LKKTLRAVVAVSAALALALPSIATATDAPQPGGDDGVQVDKSDNVRLVGHFPYKNPDGDFFKGGTDIDFQGRWVDLASSGGRMWALIGNDSSEANGTAGSHTATRAGLPPKRLHRRFLHGLSQAMLIDRTAAEVGVGRVHHGSRSRWRASGKSRCQAHGADPEAWGG